MIRCLPPEHSILLRYSESGLVPEFWPAAGEWEVGIDPYKGHPEWRGKPVEPDILIDDITRAVHALTIGQPKRYPAPS